MQYLRSTIHENSQSQHPHTDISIQSSTIHLKIRKKPLLIPKQTLSRDLNASINIKNVFLKTKSLEYIDYKHGEDVRPKEIIYNFNGQFSEKCLLEIM